MTGITAKGRRFDALDEPMHAFVTGQTVEDVQNCCKEIREIIDMHIYNPDCEKVR